MTSQWNGRRFSSLLAPGLALVLLASAGCVSAPKRLSASEVTTTEVSTEGVALDLGEALHGSLPEEASNAPLADENGHIHELGGDEFLDASAEEEVEATSVEDTEELADEASDEGIPVVLNERVEWWIEYFKGRGRTRFQTHLDRADSYAPLINTVLQSGEMPSELLYLALIESGFSTGARSHAGAVGIWQFIRGTGRRYGLVVNRSIDERRDPVRSTQAASRYLSDLYNIFGDWYLAFAAYNCGEYRVLRAIMKGNTRDFWKLSEMKLLPKETRHYVPKFLAAMQIAKNRAQYGFVSNEVETTPELAAIRVDASTSLQSIASLTGVDYALLRRLNPHLIARHTPPNVKNYSVWIPAGATESLDTNEHNVVAADSPERFSSIAEELVPVYHRVRSGETLSALAKRYGTTVSALKQMNGMRTSFLRVGQQLAVSSDKRAATQTTPRSASAKQKRVMEAARQADEAAASGVPLPQKVHVVRRGEYLGKIASRYGVSVSTLKSLNNLRSNRIYPGMTLNLPGYQRQPGNDYVFYRVQRGDSLFKIGRRFGVAVEDIKAANKIARTNLYAGELIRVPADGS